MGYMGPGFIKLTQSAVFVHAFMVTRPSHRQTHNLKIPELGLPGGFLYNDLKGSRAGRPRGFPRLPPSGSSSHSKTDDFIKMMNLFNKTHDFIKMIDSLNKTNDFIKMINSLNKTNDFIKNDKFI